MKPNNISSNNLPEIAVKVDNLSKSFKIPVESRSSIKNLVVSGFKKSKFKVLDILNDIDFEIKHGEFYGIVGRNGSGKSTLLKLLAGIYTPDKGAVHVNGKLTPFIELGVGFNPELTGKENIYLNGALLGFSRKEMKQIYPRIVEFSELEEFMDQKLKNYSSGMQVRLAFSIAIQSKSDILLFDEVLAVGDESFQRKCFDTFEQYRANNKTIILVSHDMSSIKKFCTKAMLISEGKIVDMGSPDRIASMYSKLNQEITDKETAARNKEMLDNAKVKIKICDARGKTRTSFNYGEWMTVKLEWSKNLGVKNLGVAISKESGEFIFGRNTLPLKNTGIEAVNKYEYKVKLDIGYGRYYLSCGAYGEKHSDVKEFITKGPSFIVDTKPKEGWGGIVMLNSKWE